MAGLVLPAADYSYYEPAHGVAAPVPQVTVRSKSEHDTPEQAESALLSRYNFHPASSRSAPPDEQRATAKEDGSAVVVKRIPKSNTARADAIRREIDLLWDHPHPIIPTIFEWLETPESLYMISDATPRRSLRQLVMEDMAGPVPADGAKDVMTQLFAGLAHLFLHHIAPMRLTPDLLWFDAQSNLVIGDFSAAVKYSEVKIIGQPYALVTGRWGDDIYTAPEIWDEYTYNARKAVMWSVGVVLYFMVTGQTDRLADLEHPSTLREGIQGKRRYSVATKVNKDLPRIINYPSRHRVPSWCVNIISRMLLFDPQKRPELLEVAAKVPKLMGVHGQRPLLEAVYLDYKYNVGPVGPPIEDLLRGNGDDDGRSSLFGGASSVFSTGSLTGLLAKGRRLSVR